MMRPYEQLAAFYSDPQIRHLPQVLDEIHRGQLIIPKFQRPLAWPKEMRLALLDSILEGIPIGTIMVWRTRSVEVAFKDRLGPFVLPLPDPDAPVRQYVLDGEQRLTTLYFALYGALPRTEDRVEAEEPADAFKVYYDLVGKAFVTRDDLPVVLRHHLPLTDMLQGSRLTGFQRSLGNRPRVEAHRDGHGWRVTIPKPREIVDVDKMVELSDEVADAFRQYRFPVVSVTSEDLEFVTRTFKRVNSQHVTMNEVDMVNALTHSATFDLFEQIQNMKRGALAELGWDEIEDQTILRVCKAALEVGVYDDDSEAVSKALKKNPGVLRDVEAHLCAAAGFLRKTCGIRSPSIVPYTAQIVLLAAALQNGHKPAKEVRSRLRDWLWLTTYTETFQRQMGESRFSQILEEIRALANGKLSPLPRGKRLVRRPLVRFDFRHARARGLSLLMASRAPRDPLNPSKRISKQRARTLLADHGARAMQQIVTSTMAGAQVSGSPGARILLHPESVNAMRKLLQDLHEPPPELLTSHIISRKAYRAFRDGDHATFVRLREEDLNRLESRRFDGILSRLYPSIDDLEDVE